MAGKERERMRIAVVGATGQMGRPLCAALAARPGWSVLALGHGTGPGEVEATDPASIARALDAGPDGPPDVLVNTAFWPSEEPAPAFLHNAVAPRLLAEACAARGARLVHISTDYVFSGDADEPYQEGDRTEPRSVYGISKVAGELAVRATTEQHLIVRVSSLYGAGGSRAKRGTSFVSDMLAAAQQGQTVRVVTDQIHSPTYAPDAAGCIADLIERGVTGTIHVSNLGWCSKFAFAAEIFRLAGLAPDLVPIRLRDLPPRPPRPRYTVLGHGGLRAAGLPSPRPWEEGLRAFLLELGYTPPADTPPLAQATRQMA
jgi:dTDP-4-dehydrorhamnose reductase